MSAEYEQRACFIRWATDADKYGRRYAVVSRAPCPGIGWARVDSDGKEVDASQGAFYDGVPEHPEGAEEWAANSARLHRERMRALLMEVFGEK